MAFCGSVLFGSGFKATQIDFNERFADSDDITDDWRTL